jgi:hypothetical protein
MMEGWIRVVGLSTNIHPEAESDGGMDKDDDAIFSCRTRHAVCIYITPFSG